MRTRWPLTTDDLYGGGVDVATIVDKPIIDGNTVRLPVIHNLLFECNGYPPYLDEYSKKFPKWKALFDVNIVFEGVTEFILAYQFHYDGSYLYLPLLSLDRHKIIEITDFPEIEGETNRFEIETLAPTKNWDFVTCVAYAKSMELEIPDGDVLAHMTDKLDYGKYHQRPTRWDRLKARFIEPPLP
ncbi:hypothetical protein RYZ26_19160 [Terasakiella sp. A23]|uniref:hypothetical protein n=1 Tax=Terasakiella sp. FCG-A23 TaxID=3080561 RepID=UPI002952B886|nr:hypothetical protein [Terasakiella sp. A23]MDV7341729.1 hypothetical protein [Terasakiella sp. A23]